MSLTSKIFSLFGEIVITNKKANDSIDETTKKAQDLGEELNTAGGKTEKAAKKIGTATVFWGNLAAGATEAAVKYFMKLPGAAVKAAAGVEAEEAAFESTFKGMADEASKRYRQIASETNILETRLRTAGTKGYAQLKGAGVDANTALSETEKLLRLSADAAAYYDISLEDANKRLLSFMRGNTEAGDSIGLFTSEKQRDAAALEAYGKKWLGLTEAQRQFLMLDTAKKIYEDAGVIGQATREGKEYANVTANMGEAQTQALAKVGGPIKGSLLPALDRLSQWLADSGTQTKLAEFGETLGKISNFVFDNLLAAFDWCLNNGEAVGVALTTIATGMAIGAIAAHPYAAAITAIAVGLAAIAGGHDYDKEFFGEYSAEDLEVLQRYIDAWNTLNELEAKSQHTTDWQVLMDYSKAQSTYNAVSNELDAIEGLKAAYQSWLTTQGYTNDMPYLDVPLKIKDGTENAIQSDINSMSLEGVVKLYPDTSALPDAVYAIASGKGVSTNWNAEGAIFSEPTIFNTRLGLQGVGEAGAEAVAPITKLQQYVSESVRSTIAGLNLQVVLDTGVLVGQITPQIDSRLGTLASRKGRGN